MKKTTISYLWKYLYGIKYEYKAFKRSQFFLDSKKVHSGHVRFWLDDPHLATISYLGKVPILYYI